MPYRPRKPCAQPGCRELVPAGTRYCAADRARRQKADDRQRGSCSERKYGAPWQRTRRAFLLTEWPGLGRRPILCGDRIIGPSPEHSSCVRAGVRKAGRVVDHIVRREDGGPDEPENFQLLCDHDHNVKRQAEGQEARRRA